MPTYKHYTANALCKLLESGTPTEIWTALKHNSSGPYESTGIELRHLIALSMRPELFVTLAKALQYELLRLTDEKLTEIIGIINTLNLPKYSKLFTAYAESYNVLKYVATVKKYLKPTGKDRFKSPLDNCEFIKILKDAQALEEPSEESSEESSEEVSDME